MCLGSGKLISQRVIRTHYLHCEIKKLIHKKFVKCCLPVPSIVNAHFMEKDYVFSKAMHRHGLTRHLAGSLRVYIRRIWTFLNYIQSETAEVIVGISMLSFFFFFGGEEVTERIASDSIFDLPQLLLCLSHPHLPQPDLKMLSYF